MLKRFEEVSSIKTIVKGPVYGNVCIRKRFESGLVTIGNWLFIIVYCYSKD